ncbi:MAG TPA: lytic transglycosylase domain-containing protein, partial [Polyangiaceae bacterium]
DPLERASLHELEGAALGESGDKDHAAEKLAAVIRERPLSFAALTSAARLTALGVTPPPPLATVPVVPTPPPLGIELPPRALLLSRLGFVLDAEKELLLHEPEMVTRYAPRGSEALCEAYGVIGAGGERYRVGRAAVKAEVLDRAPSALTQWAWDCVYPAPFAGIVQMAEERRGLPLGLLYAVMRQESAFRVNAVSPANAVGLLQLMPETATRVAKELGTTLDPAQLALPGPNVELGAYYLRKVFDTFGGNVALAAAAYNAGPRAVSRWLEKGENLPLDVWVARIPFTETRTYVARVVGNLARYAYLRDGIRTVDGISLELPRGVRAKETDY